VQRCSNFAMKDAGHDDELRTSSCTAKETPFPLGTPPRATCCSAAHASDVCKPARAEAAEAGPLRWRVQHGDAPSWQVLALRAVEVHLLDRLRRHGACSRRPTQMQARAPHRSFTTPSQRSAVAQLPRACRTLRRSRASSLRPASTSSTALPMLSQLPLGSACHSHVAPALRRLCGRPSIVRSTRIRDRSISCKNGATPRQSPVIPARRA